VTHLQHFILRPQKPHGVSGIFLTNGLLIISVIRFVMNFIIVVLGVCNVVVDIRSRVVAAGLD